jgi:tripartite-type tricarboxylate transporter receptor subunit TctC
MKTILLSMAALLISGAVAAQTFPAKPVRLIIPFTAGGLTDVLGRGIASELNKTWSHPMLVENRPGANQIIGAEALARSAPDGHTLLMADKAPLTLNPHLYSKLPYDAAKDFAPVLNLVHTTNILVAHTGFAPNNMQELIELARTQPGAINYGSFGLGSSTHLDTEAFASQAGIKLNHIPYKGIAEVLPAIVSGQIQIAISGIPPALGLIRQGRVKALALTGPQRSRLLPDLPTAAEAGAPSLESVSWFGLLAPAGTPRPVIERIAADVGRVISAPEFQEKFISGVGLELLNQPAEPFAERIRADREKGAARVKNVNVRLD